MAYPGEKTNKEYQDYVIEAQSKGETPLTLEEWKKANKPSASNKKPQNPVMTALSKY